MNDFLDKLLKIRSEFFKRMKFLFILDLISIFSIFYAIFIIFQLEYFLENSSIAVSVPIPIYTIPPFLAFIIAIMGVILLHKKDHKINVTLLIENKYPEMREKLRTAYDNRNETNVIVESLKSLVLSGLTVVSASTLLSRTAVITKIILVIIFISGATFVSLNPEYRIPPEIVTNFTTTVAGSIGNFTNATLEVSAPAATGKVGTGGGGEIFGKPRIAPIEGKPVDLSLDMGLGTGNLPRDYKEMQSRFIRSAVFPVDILGSNVSDGGYSILMKKTEIEKELINKYAVERSKI